VWRTGEGRQIGIGFLAQRDAHHVRGIGPGNWPGEGCAGGGEPGTFHGACEAARGAGSLGWVVYGAGNAVLRAFPGTLQWPRQPDVWWYFGDVDRRGLGIAAQLASFARRLGAPAPVRLAVPLYDPLVFKNQDPGIELTDDAPGGPPATTKTA